MTTDILSSICSLSNIQTIKQLNFECFKVTWSKQHWLKSSDFSMHSLQSDINSLINTYHLPIVFRFLDVTINIPTSLH